MSLPNRSNLRRVETYDGNAKRPIVNQLSDTDATVSQAFWTGQKTITTASTPEALHNKVLNPGVIAVIKAKTANTSEISIGTSSVSAVFSSTYSFKMIQGESFKFRVDNLNRIWVDVTTSGDGVEIVLI